MSHSRVEPDSGSVYRTPRWVKAIGIIALTVIVLVAVVLFTDVGGEHGPGRHLLSGEGGDTAAIDSAVQHIAPIEHSTQQP